jgi:hypothetical protein
VEQHGIYCFDDGGSQRRGAGRWMHIG